MECSGSFHGDILSDYEWLALCQILLYFLLTKMQAVLVIDHDLFAFYYLCLQRGKTFLITEAIICLSLFNEFPGIFHVDASFHTFTLYIGTVTAILIRTFVMGNTGFGKRIINDIYSTLYKTLLIGIFDPEHKISASMLGN